MRLNCAAFVLICISIAALPKPSYCEEDNIANVTSQTTATQPSSLNIIPRPSKASRESGEFQIRSRTQIFAGTGTRPEAELFAEQISPATGFHLVIEDVPTTPVQTAGISMSLNGDDKSLGEEGYRLKVKPDRIEISAFRAAGIFYACQTLRQLLPPEILGRKKSKTRWIIPCVTIEDFPRFAWRGHLFDVGRHFFTVDEVKRAIDLMALHKMNRFHWHLTEDQGWRIEIKRYPRLTEIGAWRREKDGSRYGGFYTQSEIRDVVAYATARHVIVIPEIEMPGHSSAAIASYPELGCTGGPYSVQNDWGIYKDVYCAGQEQTFIFIENVLDEVMQLFPSQYIHVGGDECPKDRWKTCPKCQSRIAAEGLKDEHELQSYFIRRIDKYLDSHGRRLIGWDEILEGGLAPGAIVQSWRGTKGGIDAAKGNHDVIMSPTQNCYLDYSYVTTPLKLAYSYEPIPAELDANETTHILGIEGNIWTEHVSDIQRYDFQVYPRLAALAEVAWSQKDQRSWDDFENRMKVEMERYRILGVKPGKADDLSTAGASVIGHWTPGEMKEPGVELEWDISRQVRSGGLWDVIPWYTSGTAALQIQWVALLKDGKELNRDAHEGWSGADKRDLIYRIRAGKSAQKTTSTFTIRALVKPAGSLDSYGDVYLRKAKK